MKTILKQMLDGICLILVFPLYCIQRGIGLVRRDPGAFWTFSQLLSLIPGKTGSYLRKNYYRLAMTACDKHCAILFGTLFSQADTEIGRGVYIGPYCNIGRCRIENHCTLGSNVHIMSGSRQHGFEDLETPVQDQKGVFEKVTIGEDTWIGNCALVMANVGKKCIIGAGSVVVKDLPDYSIAVGNPAKVIGKRGSPIGHQEREADRR